ncbi:MAG TPA: hypothetical protein PKD00_00385, partial [Burkholderiales bacterium]|nr:hypothetical protein [Burkholderiales bacterium]
FDAGYSDLTTADITDSVSWIGLGFRNCAITLDTDVNAILAHLVSIGFTGSLDIMGGTNAAPTGQGILDVATLIGNGASVITN